MNNTYKEIELEIIGNKSAVNLFRRDIISFDVLKSALLCGYTVQDIENAYDKFLNLSKNGISFSFDDIILGAIECERCSSLKNIMQL